MSECSLHVVGDSVGKAHRKNKRKEDEPWTGDRVGAVALLAAVERYRAGAAWIGRPGGRNLTRLAAQRVRLQLCVGICCSRHNVLLVCSKIQNMHIFLMVFMHAPAWYCL